VIDDESTTSRNTDDLSTQLCRNTKGASSVPSLVIKL